MIWLEQRVPEVEGQARDWAATDVHSATGVLRFCVWLSQSSLGLTGDKAKGAGSSWKAKLLG